MIVFKYWWGYDKNYLLQINWKRWKLANLSPIIESKHCSYRCVPCFDYGFEMKSWVFLFEKQQKMTKIYPMKETDYDLIDLYNILYFRHEGPVWQVTWAHPMFGNLLASCSYDRKVWIYFYTT